MLCPNCQKEVSETAKICGYCGTRLTQPAPAPSPVEEVPVEPLPLENIPPAPKEVYVPESELVPPPVVEQPVSREDVPSHKPESTKKPLPRWVWWLIGLPIAIGVNYLFGYLFNRVIDFSLDMLGTVVITVILGPVAGLIAGIGLCLLATVTYFDLSYYFIPVHILFALGAWVTHRMGWFRSWWKTILSSLVNNFIVQVVVTITVLLGFYAPHERTIEAVKELVPNSIFNPLYLQLTGIYFLVWLGLKLFDGKNN